jgi:hypothetical protein
MAKEILQEKGSFLQVRFSGWIWCHGDYTYPTWAITFGWFLAIISIAPLPIYMAKEILQEKGSFLQVRFSGGFGLHIES